MNNKTLLPQENHTKIQTSKLQKALQSIHNKPRLIFEVIGIILLLSSVSLASNNIPREDYDALQNEYESLQSDHETLQTNYDLLQNEYDTIALRFEATTESLNNTLSAYEEYQQRMTPFNSLTDEELNIVASGIPATLEAKQTVNNTSQTAEPQATTQQAQQQTPEGTVWIPRTGSKYHSNSNCSNMDNPHQVTLDEAVNAGYEPCKKCY